jgi:uncharacterized protein
MNYIEIEHKIFKKLTKGLSKNLHYHGIHHTKEVITNTLHIANEMNVTSADKKLLKLAALFHDVGFLEIYTGHEEIGCRIAQETLAAIGFDLNKINKICGMIMATKIPQKPVTVLEQIIADADLMYLGTTNFEKIANTLYTELKAIGKIDNELEWNTLQANFMEKHHFHTNYCIENYSAQKQLNLQKVINWLKKN